MVSSWRSMTVESELSGWIIILVTASVNHMDPKEREEHMFHCWRFKFPQIFLSAPHCVCPPHSLLPGAAAAAAAASGGCLSWMFYCWPAPSLTPSALPPAASWRRSTRPGTSCSTRCASPSSRTSAASTSERGGSLETTVEKKKTASSPPRTAAGPLLTSKGKVTLRSGWRWPHPSSLWSAVDCCAHSTRLGCSGLTCPTLVTGLTGELPFITSLLHSH